MLYANLNTHAHTHTPLEPGSSCTYTPLEPKAAPLAFDSCGHTLVTLFLCCCSFGGLSPLSNNLMLRTNLEYAEHLCSLNLRTAATRRQQFIPTFLRIPDFQYRQLLGSKLLGLLAVGCWLATDELSVPSRLAPSVTPPPSHKRKVKSLVDQRRGPRYQQAVSATP